MQYRELIYRIHARQSMFARSISDECVEHIIRRGEVIETIHTRSRFRRSYC